MRVIRSAELRFGQLPGRRSADPFEEAPIDGASVRFARLAPGPRAPHRHPLSIEVIHVLEGEGTHWQEGETERVGPGDVVLVERGVAHATVPATEAGMLLYCLFPVSTLEGNVEELEGAIEL